MKVARSLSERIVAFPATLDRDRVLEKYGHLARRALLDTVACAIAGSREEAAERALRYGRNHTSDAMASIWWTGEPTSVEQASLVNGVAAHVLDYDDVTPPMRGHPSAAMLPALVALAEAEGRTAADLSFAYIVGLEVICKLSHPIGAGHYMRGWHSTATIGLLGAVCACSELLRLSVTERLDALGLALSQVGGTQLNFGTMAKSFQAGQANAAAVRAVLLARHGFTASHSAIEGRNGFLALFTQHGGAEFGVFGEEPLEIARTGLDVKKYPMCYAAHRTVDGILDIRREHPGITLDTVERVDLRTSPQAFLPLTFAQPKTGLEGKFSIQYAVTAALLDGGLWLSSFTDESVRRPEIRRNLHRVRFEDTEGSLSPRWVEIRLTPKVGAPVFLRVDRLRGSAAVPLTKDELFDKLRDCCRHSGLAWDYQSLGESILAATDVAVADVIRLRRFINQEQDPLD